MVEVHIPLVIGLRHASESTCARPHFGPPSADELEL